MTKLEIKGAGNITRGKRKQKWARLTDDDLQYAEGKPDGLTGRSQKRMGETREAVAKPSGNFSPPVPAMKRTSDSAIKFILLFFAAMVSAACLLGPLAAPSGAAASSGRTVVVDDVSSDSRYLACSLETKSEIVVPVFAHGKVSGELDIDSHFPAAFGNEDRELVEYCAELVGQRLEHK